MSEFILTSLKNSVMTITLNRPEVMNAWNAAMRNQLIEAFQAAEENTAVKAVILTGAGDRAFGAGQDLNETKTFDADRAEVWIGEWEKLYTRIRTLSSRSSQHSMVLRQVRHFRSLFFAISALLMQVFDRTAGNQFRYSNDHWLVDHA
ncbi:enoyl-CoA hydratase/isomerase family protein [Brucella pituitosa]|uniref:enoyl-CoA hydratase/isomerase family protein n=1 Tax=Brucella pituitosa TaxID=571256 RepID=UPI00338FE32B